MLLSRDKKVLIYLFLLILLGSVNNKYFIDSKFFIIKNLKLVGLSGLEKLDILLQLEQIKNKKKDQKTQHHYSVERHLIPWHLSIVTCW